MSHVALSDAFPLRHSNFPIGSFQGETAANRSGHWQRPTNHFAAVGKGIGVRQRGDPDIALALERSAGDNLLAVPTCSSRRRMSYTPWTVS
jgi:hypothetical protein